MVCALSYVYIYWKWWDMSISVSAPVCIWKCKNKTMYKNTHFDCAQLTSNVLECHQQVILCKRHPLSFYPPPLFFARCRFILLFALHCERSTFVLQRQPYVYAYGHGYMQCECIYYFIVSLWFSAQSFSRLITNNAAFHYNTNTYKQDRFKQ